MCPTMARDPGSLGIRILAIAARLFATGLTAMVPDEMAAMLTRDAAFPKRMGHPEEYAKLVLARRCSSARIWGVFESDATTFR